MSDHLKVVVTTVHGTWGSKSPWALTDSRLMRHLETRLGVTPDRFKWSGCNRQKSRIEAAIALRHHIDALYDDEVNQPKQHYLVAHSHGGNVALLACNDETTANRISGVICLNTPFLYFRKTQSQLSYLGALPAAILAAINLYVAYTGSNAVTLATVFWATVVLLALTITATPMRPRQCEYKETVLPSIGTQKLLVMKSVGDEAHGVLAGAAFSNWFAVFATGVARLVPRSIWLLLFVSLFFAAFYVDPGILTGSRVARAMYMLITVFTIAWLMRVIGMALSLGWDTPFRYRNQMITAEPVPRSGGYEVHLVEPSLSHQGKEVLKHSTIYKDDRVIAKATSWLDAMMSKQT